QRDDPRESAHAHARAFRGLGVLRQADARTPRGLEPAPLARDAYVRPRTERDLARELRRAARALLAVGRRRAAPCGPAGLRSRGAVLGRGVPLVPLALSRDAHAR